MNILEIVTVFSVSVIHAVVGARSLADSGQFLSILENNFHPWLLALALSRTVSFEQQSVLVSGFGSSG